MTKHPKRSVDEDSKTTMINYWSRTQDVDIAGAGDRGATAARAGAGAGLSSAGDRARSGHARAQRPCLAAIAAMRLRNCSFRLFWFSQNSTGMSLTSKGSGVPFLAVTTTGRLAASA